MGMLEVNGCDDMMQSMELMADLSVEVMDKMLAAEAAVVVPKQKAKGHISITSGLGLSSAWKR